MFNEPSPQQPPEKLKDFFFTSLNLNSTNPHSDKPFTSPELIENVSVCYQAGRIPQEVLPLIRKITNYLSERHSPHLDAFLESIEKLALIPATPEQKKWDGLKALSVICSNHHGKVIIEKFFNLYDKIEDKTHVGLLYDHLRLLKDNIRSTPYLGYIAALEHASSVPEYNLKIGSQISLLLIKNALEHNWSAKVLGNFITSIQSSNRTEEGQQERHKLLAGPVQKTTYQRLSLISTAEDELKQLNISDSERNSIILSPHRDSYASSLRRLYLVTQKELLAKLIIQAEQIPEVGPESLATSLNNHRKNLPKLINGIHELANSGIGIEYAILLAGRQNDHFSGVREILLDAYEDQTKIYQLLSALEVAVERIAPFPENTRTIIYTECLNRLEKNNSATLIREESFDMLLRILHGTGLNEDEKIYSKDDLMNAIIELSSKTEIFYMLYAQSEAYDSMASAFRNNYNNDNPPFSLDEEPKSLQIRFQEQIDSVFRRAQDAHYGFAAATYIFKHTPQSRLCYFDQFAAGINADLYLIPSNDISRFPGRGRIITNIDTDLLFANGWSEQQWKEHIFPAYGPLEGSSVKGNFHAIDNLTRSRLTFMRAFDGTAVPSNRFFDIAGEPMTLIAWNHHFNSSTVHELSLVPSRAFDSFFDRVAIPLDHERTSTSIESSTDIAHNPPTLRAIDQRAHEMGLNIGVINITSGSVFSGGFCNAPQPFSSPYHTWEQRVSDSENYVLLDAFGHLHKYYIQRQKADLDKLYDLHQRIYEVTTGLLNVRDVFKFSIGLDARGQVEYYRASEQLLPDVKYGAGILQHFCTSFEEYWSTENRNLAPILVAEPADIWAAPPQSPFILDGTNGFVFSAWGKPFEINTYKGAPDDQLVEWWKDNVDPYLEENFWLAPRLIARDTYAELIEEYKRGT